MKKEIEVNGLLVQLKKQKNEDYISLTDIAKKKNPFEPKDVVKNWLRSKSTIEFLGLWEKLNNKTFKGVEFDSLLKDSGNNTFTLSPTRWIETTNAIGITSSMGKNGGTYAHSEIALEFASWVSSEFKLYLITELKRLKKVEFENQNLQWSVQRTIAKINYKIHTDAIKENLIPETKTKKIITGRKVQIPLQLKLIQTEMGIRKTVRYFSFFIGMIVLKNNNILQSHQVFFMDLKKVFLAYQSNIRYICNSLLNYESKSSLSNQARTSRSL